MTETLELVEELTPQEPPEDTSPGEAFGPAPDAQQEPQPDAGETAAANAAVIRQLVLQAKDAGMEITGPGGLLEEITKMVIESALDEEMAEHLGKNAPQGSGSA